MRRFPALHAIHASLNEDFSASCNHLQANLATLPPSAFLEVFAKLAQIRHDLTQYYNKSIGPLHVNPCLTRDTLLPQLAERVAELEKLTMKSWKKRVDSLLKDISDARKTVSEQSTKAASFSALATAVREVEEALPRFRERALSTDLLFEVIDRQTGYPITAAERGLRESLFGNPTAADLLQQALNTAKDFTAAKSRDVVNDLESQATQLYDDLTHVKNTLQDDTLVSRATNPEDALKQLAEMEKVVAVKEKHIEDVVSCLAAIDGAKPRAASDARAALQKKRVLWETFQQWQSLQEEVHSLPIADVNAADYRVRVESYHEKANRMRAEENLDVAEHFFQVTAEEVTLLPLIACICNPSLTSEHWKPIFEALQRPYVATASYTIASLLAWNIQSHVALLEAKSRLSTGQAGIKRTLSDLESQWASCRLTIDVGPSTSTTCAHVSLKNADRIFERLEDSTQAVRNLMTSEYVQNLHPVLKGWHENLAKSSQQLASVQDLIRSRATLQSNGRPLCDPRYLSQLDHSVKEVAAKAAETPVLKLLTASSTAAMLQDCFNTIKAAKDALDQQFNALRKENPRLQLLSNGDVQKFVSAASVASDDYQYNQVFPCIRKLICHNQYYVGARSLEGEALAFSPPVPLGNKTSIVGDIQAAIALCVRDDIKKALGSRPPSTSIARRHRWLKSSLTQAAWICDQIAWTASIEQAVQLFARRTAKPADEAAKPRQNPFAACFEAHSHTVQATVEITRSPCGDTLSTRITVSCVLTLALHAQEVVRQLVADPPSALTDFRFQKILRRHYNPAEHPDHKVTHGPLSLRYKSEYTGAVHRLVQTPQLDRATLGLALHVHSLTCSAVHGSQGRTEMVVDYAKNFGVHVLVVTCTGDLDASSTAKAAMAAAQNGSWVLFDGAEKLRVDVLAVLGQLLETIARAIGSGKPNFAHAGVKCSLPSGFAAFLTVSDPQNGEPRSSYFLPAPACGDVGGIPKSLKQTMRPVLLQPQDTETIARVMLQTRGFEHADSLAALLHWILRFSALVLPGEPVFCLRSLVRVIHTAHDLKVKQPGLLETTHIEEAVRAVFLYNLTKNDAPSRFRSVVAHFFDLPAQASSEVWSIMTRLQDEACVQPHSALATQVHQIATALKATATTLLVGSPCTGKTTCFTSTAEALGVQTIRIFPLALNSGDLYGRYHPESQRWIQGIVPFIFETHTEDTRRKASVANTHRSSVLTTAGDGGNVEPILPPAKCVIHFDGPLGGWIDFLIPLLSEPRQARLGDRVLATPDGVSFSLETASLHNATPSLLTRVSLVTFDDDCLDASHLLFRHAGLLKRRNIGLEEHGCTGYPESALSVGALWLVEHMIPCSTANTVALLLDGLVKENAEYFSQGGSNLRKGTSTAEEDEVLLTHDGVVLASFREKPAGAATATTAESTERGTDAGAEEGGALDDGGASAASGGNCGGHPGSFARGESGSPAASERGGGGPCAPVDTTAGFSLLLCHAMAWGVASCTPFDALRAKWNPKLDDLFGRLFADGQLPPEDHFSVQPCLATHSFVPWADIEVHDVPALPFVADDLAHAVLRLGRLSVHAGNSVVITGPRISGKSALLRQLERDACAARHIRFAPTRRTGLPDNRGRVLSWCIDDVHLSADPCAVEFLRCCVSTGAHHAVTPRGVTVAQTAAVLICALDAAAGAEGDGSVKNRLLDRFSANCVQFAVPDLSTSSRGESLLRKFLAKSLEASPYDHIITPAHPQLAEVGMRMLEAASTCLSSAGSLTTFNAIVQAVQGFRMFTSRLSSVGDALALWYHELSRAFIDPCVCKAADTSWASTTLRELFKEVFGLERAPDAVLLTKTWNTAVPQPDAATGDDAEGDAALQSDGVQVAEITEVLRELAPHGFPLHRAGVQRVLSVARLLRIPGSCLTICGPAGNKRKTVLSIAAAYEGLHLVRCAGEKDLIAAVAFAVCERVPVVLSIDLDTPPAQSAKPDDDLALAHIACRACSLTQGSLPIDLVTPDFIAALAKCKLSATHRQPAGETGISMRKCPENLRVAVVATAARLTKVSREFPALSGDFAAFTFPPYFKDELIDIARARSHEQPFMDEESVDNLAHLCADLHLAACVADTWRPQDFVETPKLTITQAEAPPETGSAPQTPSSTHLTPKTARRKRAGSVSTPPPQPLEAAAGPRAAAPKRRQRKRFSTALAQKAAGFSADSWTHDIDWAEAKFTLAHFSRLLDAVGAKKERGMAEKADRLNSAVALIGAMLDKKRVETDTLAHLNTDLEDLSDRADEMDKRVEMDSQAVTEGRMTLEREEAALQKNAAEIRRLQSEISDAVAAQVELVAQAVAGLKTIVKKDIDELLIIKAPPLKILHVWETVTGLCKPEAKQGWDACKRFLADKPVEKVQALRVEEKTERILAKAQAFITDPEMQPAAVKLLSPATALFCQWVLSACNLATAYQKVTAKRETIAASEEARVDMEEVVSRKKAAVKGLELQLKKSEAEHAAATKEYLAIQETRSTAECVLERNASLIAVVGSKQTEWSDEAERLGNLLSQLAVQADHPATVYGPSLPPQKRSLFFAHMRRILRVRSQNPPAFPLGSPVSPASSAASTPCSVQSHGSEATAAGPDTHLAEWLPFASDSVLPEARWRWGQHGLPTDDYNYQSAFCALHSPLPVLLVDPHGVSVPWLQSVHGGELNVVSAGATEALKESVRCGQPTLVVGFERVTAEIEAALAEARRDDDGAEAKGKLFLLAKDAAAHHPWLDPVRFSADTADLTTTVEAVLAAAKEPLLCESVAQEIAKIETCDHRLRRLEEELLDILGHVDTAFEQTELMHGVKVNKAAREAAVAQKKEASCELASLASRKSTLSPTAPAAAALFAEASAASEAFVCDAARLHAAAPPASLGFYDLRLFARILHRGGVAAAEKACRAGLPRRHRLHRVFAQSCNAALRADALTVPEHSFLRYYEVEDRREPVPVDAVVDLLSQRVPKSKAVRAFIREARRLKSWAAAGSPPVVTGAWLLSVPEMRRWEKLVVAAAVSQATLETVFEALFDAQQPSPRCLLEYAPPGTPIYLTSDSTAPSVEPSLFFLQQLCKQTGQAEGLTTAEACESVKELQKKLKCCVHLGSWLLINNAHLAPHTLRQLVRDVSVDAVKNTFRLWYTDMLAFV
ncbi:Dynein-1-beta heavy chain [Diplonema papillatum]|nr:Dynein-1-beta heavy chain [Diplonema papillatum]